MKKGFTLIELLIVVLIIGILAAIALPMYQKAVLKSRFAALMPIVKAMNNSNEAYYLEHNSYASNPQELPVQGQVEYPTGTTLEFGQNMDYAYVLASNSDARNNYIMYQKRSANYPEEIHCEAIEGDELAEAVCVSAGGEQNIGTTLTSGYTTYVLSGAGAGFPPGYNALLERVSCETAEVLGFTCTQTVDEENNTITKKICTTVGNSVFCRTKEFHEDGSYTSVTCQANEQNVCKYYWKSATYDANGNLLTQRACSSVNASGNCKTYGVAGNHYDYTYDENGNLLSTRTCNIVDSSSGACTSYSSNNAYEYTYDANGNKLSERTCSSVDGSSGACTAYSNNGFDYTYDANGNKLSERKCSTVDSNGTCTAYSSSSSKDYRYDENGHLLAQRSCSSIDSEGTCTAYSTGFNYTYDENGHRRTGQYCLEFDSSENCTWNSTVYNYTYDANGNLLAQRSCSKKDSNGICTTYSSDYSYDYTYDANGNKLTDRKCSRVDSSGTCTGYSSSQSYEYTYDANGHLLTERACQVMSSDGRCLSYSSSGNYDYLYDDNGYQVVKQSCSNVDTSTGGCTSYNSTAVQAN